MVSQRRVASRREADGFTLGEIVFVVVVAIIVFVLGVHGCHRAREYTNVPRCRGNLHHIWFSTAQWREDHGDAWPRFYDPGAPLGPNVNAFGRLVDENYVNDMTMLKCVVQPLRPRLAPAWSGLGPREGSAPSVIDSTFAYDNARIPPNADPARIVMGDMLETVRRPDGDAFAQGGNVSVDDFWPGNHIGGANVLFADGTVRWLPVRMQSRFWIPYQGLSAQLPEAAGNWASYEEWAWGEAWRGYPLAAGACRYDFVRAGSVANPRLTGAARTATDAASGAEAEAVADSAVATATDADIFAIDAETPGQFALLGEWQFRTGWVRLDAAGQPNDDPASGALRVPMSKTDCAMQPGLGFRAGTGWPDSVYPIGDQTPATPREEWTSTAGIALGIPPRSSRAMWSWIGGVATAVVIAAAVLVLHRRRRTSRA